MAIPNFKNSADVDPDELEEIKQWHDENDDPEPKVLVERILQAKRLSDAPLTLKQRKGMVRHLERLINANRSVLHEVLSEFEPELEKAKKDIINDPKDPERKKEEPLTPAEHRKRTLTLNQFNSIINAMLDGLDLEPEVMRTIITIKHELYQDLKDILEPKLCVKARTVVDHSLDHAKELDLHAAIRHGLNTAYFNLKPVADISDVKLIYVDQNKRRGKQITVSRNTMPKVSERNFQNYEWQSLELIEDDELPELTVEYALIPNKTRNKSIVFFKLNLGDEETAYLEFDFNSTDIHHILKHVCGHISGVIDTFMESRLQSELSDYIHRRKKEILDEHKMKDWRIICEKSLEVLSDVLDRPVNINCKRFGPNDDEMWEKEVKAENIIITSNNEDRNTYQLVVEGVNMGEINIECHNAAEETIIHYMVEAIADILRQREQTRNRIGNALGCNVAKAYMDGNMETMPTEHEVGVLYADIVQFSKFTKELKDEARRNDIEEHLIVEIINKLLTKSATKLEKQFNVVIDKFVGDEIIALIRPPFTKDGRDIFGNKKINVKKNFEIATALAAAIQDELQIAAQEAKAKVEKEFGIKLKLPRRLLFSFGYGIAKDLVGPYGDLEDPESRLDYTVFGHDMNLIARILGEARANQVLVWKKSFDKLEKGKSTLTSVGYPFVFHAKNIGFAEVIAVEQKEAQKKREEEISKLEDEIVKMQKTQRGKKNENVLKFATKAKKADFTALNPETIHKLPDGYYSLKDEGHPKKGELYRVTIMGDKTNYAVDLPNSDNIQIKEVYVTASTYKKIQDEDNETMLLKRGEDFVLVKHVCIEDEITNIFDKKIKRNAELGKIGNEFSIKDLPPGEYEIMGYKNRKRKGDRIFTLRRKHILIELVLKKDEKSLKGNGRKTGTLVFDDGVCKCSAGGPDWTVLYAA